MFYVLFIGQTVLVALSMGTIALLTGGRRTQLSWGIARYWCWSNLKLMRFLTGIHTEVLGAENIPPGGCIIASKHQSDWDVFAIFPHTGRPAYIVKNELMRIPFFGSAASSMDCIAVDRSKGAEAIPLMLRKVREKLALGCRIVIFPEGTRKQPLAPAQYRAGITRMYRELNVPVVPVALNSGLFWGRNSLILWPGIARARILPAIPPGLDPAQFQARLVSAIETESDALILRAARDGLTRPIPPDLRKGLDALAERAELGTTASAD